jgi:L-alanine-DL-glutamate epimerase-like enolase superfamily enzyme
MSSTRIATQVAVEDLEVIALQVPTATDEESDGTLVWDSTSVVVVEAHAGGQTGLGYTYCHPAAASVVEQKLASVVCGADALMPQRTWAQLQVEGRQMGHAGILEMAVSAVDVALWDLKARLVDVCLADLLPRYREGTPFYASGGFTDYSDDQLRDQVGGWRTRAFGRSRSRSAATSPPTPTASGSSGPRSATASS